jgi:hypothetical protein
MARHHFGDVARRLPVRGLEVPRLPGRRERLVPVARDLVPAVVRRRGDDGADERLDLVDLRFLVLALALARALRDGATSARCSDRDAVLLGLLGRALLERSRGVVLRAHGRRNPCRPSHAWPGPAPHECGRQRLTSVEGSTRLLPLSRFRSGERVGELRRHFGGRGSCRVRLTFGQPKRGRCEWDFFG